MKTMKFVYEAPSTNLVVLRLRRVVLTGSNLPVDTQSQGAGDDMDVENGQW